MQKLPLVYSLLAMKSCTQLQPASSGFCPSSASLRLLQCLVKFDIHFLRSAETWISSCITQQCFSAIEKYAFRQEEETIRPGY